MTRDTASRWIIRRRDNTTTNGKPNPPHTYVTGPHIGTSLDRGIYSSTDDPHEASTFTRADADHLVRTKWRGLHPEVLPAPPYDPADD